MIPAYEIRQRARAVLGNHVFNNAWVYALLVCLAVTVINSALAFTGVGTLLVYGILTCAMSHYFLGRVRGMIPHDGLSSLIDGARKDLAGALVTGLLYNVFILLWTLLFIIPGIVKSCAYAMTFYIKNDHPEYTATEAITESRRMMDGHKMDFFLLQLSFIGWWIVGVLCFGIGTLWVQAYNETANAIFYEELKAKEYVYIPCNTNT